MSQIQPNQSVDETESFAQQLRLKAQQAVDASLHHAQLSQRYMDLSRQFSELAENATNQQLPKLQQQADRLTADIASISQPNVATPRFEPKTARPQSPPPPLPTASQSQPFANLGSPETVAVSREPHSNTAQSNLSLIESPNKNNHTTQNADTLDGASSKPTETQNSLHHKRSAKLNTRTFVQRVRAVRLAAAKRIRVKAKKEDLKPRERSATDELKRSQGSLFGSTVLCIAIIAALSLLTVNIEANESPPAIVAAFSPEEQETEEESLPVELPIEEVGEQVEQPTEEPILEKPEPLEPEPPEPEPPESEPPQLTDPPEVPQQEMPALEMPETPTGIEPTDDSDQPADPATVDNRSAAGRKVLLQKYGGSAASESAVGNALKWLASVQHPDGWWDFDTVGPSGYPGTINNPIGGTAYALLPFLAAGNSHKEGPYKKNVAAGIKFLTNVGINAPAGYDLRGIINKNSDDKEPNEAYYVHGAATLALCEVYGMTKDRRLRPICEKAIRFMVNSQDPRAGGWRYNPQEAGSTSVTAIQVMALVSAKKAGIKVNDNVFKGVMNYLDGVQVDGKGRYGYEAEKRTYKGSCTAMALLCRMYCGWQRDDGDMADGVKLLDKAGPYDNLYSLYFATQVMKNWGGKEWERWNTRMRDDLIAQQETAGPATGSWSPRTGAIHAKQGGRLLSTALATLTLEVYYRYKPLLPEQTP